MNQKVKFMIAKHAEKKIKKNLDASARKSISWKDFNVVVGEEIKNVLFAKEMESFT
jgi:hypothetical protein